VDIDMAIMIPPTIPDKATKGEKQIFSILEKNLSNNYVCWHEPEIHNKHQTRYPDFVIAGPDIGILTIEVKDWSLDAIIEANPDNITILTSEGEQQRSNPSKQAREYSILLSNILKRDGNPLLVFQDGIHKNKLKFPYTSCVAFPHIRRDAFNQHFLSMVLETETVLCIDDFVETRERLVKIASRQFKANLNKDQLDNIRAILWPEIKIGKNLLLDVRQEQLAKAGFFNWEDDSDIRYPNNTIDPSTIDPIPTAIAKDFRISLVRGAPGSGKTMTLLIRARLYLDKFPNHRVLLLTYNRQLATVLAEHYAEIEKEYYAQEIAHVSTLLSSNLTIINFHKWCYDLLLQANKFKKINNILSPTTGIAP
jgi:hypothetical protein